MKTLLLSIFVLIGVIDACALPDAFRITVSDAQHGDVELVLSRYNVCGSSFIDNVRLRKKEVTDVNDSTVSYLDFRVFPNLTAGGMITLHFEEDIKSGVFVKIYNLKAEQIYSSHYEHGCKFYDIQLPQGVGEDLYLMAVSTAKEKGVTGVIIS